MKRLLALAVTSVLAAAPLSGCAWLFDSGEYEARPQTGGQGGLPDRDSDDDYLKDQSNR